MMKMSRLAAVVLLIVSGCAEASFFPGAGPQLSPRKTGKSFPDHDKILQAIGHFELQMAPAVSLHGGHLHVVHDTSENRVNAEARRQGKDWFIVVYDGLLRHSSIGPAELTLVLCHELGHHLGGPPTAARGGWAACEGQADYWSTLDCFGRLRPTDDARGTALRLTELYASFSGGAFPRLDCHDSARVSRTFYGYPSPQCRLDTLVAGVAAAPRPECWYVP